MLEEALKFYERLPGYSRDTEISSRLQKAVATALRNAYYDLVNNPRELETKLIEHLYTAFIDSRMFDRARNKKECLEIAEKIARELIRLSEGDVERMRKLFEFIVKIQKIKEKNLFE